MAEARTRPGAISSQNINYRGQIRIWGVLSHSPSIHISVQKFTTGTAALCRIELSKATDRTKSSNKRDGHDSEDPKQSTADMAAFVQNLLQQMQSRFQMMSDSIITNIDEMGSRIDELEQSINDLRAEMIQIT